MEDGCFGQFFRQNLNVCVDFGIGVFVVVDNMVGVCIEVDDGVWGDIFSNQVVFFVFVEFLVVNVECDWLVFQCCVIRLCGFEFDIVCIQGEYFGQDFFVNYDLVGGLCIFIGGVNEIGVGVEVEFSIVFFGCCD